MAKFVMLSTIGPEGSARLRDTPERLLEVTAEVEAMGVKIERQLALLGRWDFLTIIDAPDEKAMARVAMALNARGTLKTMTLAAVDIDEFVAVLAEDDAAD
jgi:uncharacterized protein with GYD domain